MFLSISMFIKTSCESVKSILFSFSEFRLFILHIVQFGFIFLVMIIDYFLLCFLLLQYVIINFSKYLINITICIIMNLFLKDEENVFSKLLYVYFINLIILCSYNIQYYVFFINYIQCIFEIRNNFKKNIKLP